MPDHRHDSLFTLPPPLFLFHAAKKGVDINGHENRLGRNPSSLCESFTRAHQDSAFKLVKSTTRGGGTRWYTQKRWAVPHSGGGCVESAMENRDRATVADIKGCHSLAASLNTQLRAKNLHRKRKRSSNSTEGKGDEEYPGERKWKQLEEHETVRLAFSKKREYGSRLPVEARW